MSDQLEINRTGPKSIMCKCGSTEYREEHVVGLAMGTDPYPGWAQRMITSYRYRYTCIKCGAEA